MLVLIDPIRFEISQTLTAAADGITVRQDVFDAFANALQAGDYSYLFVTQGSRFEWIKVLPPDLNTGDNVLPIERGALGSSPLTFPCGACATSRMGPGVVQDMVDSAVSEAVNGETTTESGEECPASISSIEGDGIDAELEDGDCNTKVAKITLDMPALLSDILEGPLNIVDGKLQLDIKNLPVGGAITSDTVLLGCQGGQLYQYTGAQLISFVNSCRENQ